MIWMARQCRSERAADEDEHYKLIKDYSRNDARKQGKCDDYDRELRDGPLPKQDPVKPTRLTGVMMVLEVEGVTNLDGFESKIEELLLAEGIHPLPGIITHNASSREVTKGLFLAMQEGYMDAHYYPSISHVGLEIILWSEIYKHDGVRAALLEALGSPANGYSSFRVIHGGMLGAKNWKEDVDAVVPVKRSLCNCDVDRCCRCRQHQDSFRRVDQGRI